MLRVFICADEGELALGVRVDGVWSVAVDEKMLSRGRSWEL